MSDLVKKIHRGDMVLRSDWRFVFLIGKSTQQGKHRTGATNLEDDKIIYTYVFLSLLYANQANYPAYSNGLQSHIHICAWA